MLIHSNEAELREGRFARFARTQQPATITIERKLSSGEHLRMLMTEMITWCGEYTQATWSFRVNMNSVHDIRTDFSFEDETEAVAFALLWS
jgi:hypothetical protein